MVSKPEDGNTVDGRGDVVTPNSPIVSHPDASPRPQPISSTQSRPLAKKSKFVFLLWVVLCLVSSFFHDCASTASRDPRPSLIDGADLSDDDDHNSPPVASSDGDGMCD